MQAGLYHTCPKISRDQTVIDTGSDPDNTDRWNDVNKLIIELLETEIE